MKSLTVISLSVLSFTWLSFTWLPARAEVPADGEWSAAIRQVQRQLAEKHPAEAVQSSKQALRIAKRFGPSDNRVAASYFQIGNIYRDWGRCTDAHASFVHALTVWRKQANPQPKHLFIAMISVLDTMCECEDYKAAAKKFSEFEPDLERYRSDPIDDAELLATHGMIARALKHYREAEGYYRREIELLQKTPGVKQLQIEEDRVNLAMVLAQQGRHEEALAEARHVIEFLGPDGPAHPSMFAGALNNAACALADLGRKEEAQRTLERALQIAEDAFGEDTRFTARLMLNYARVLRENKETPAAENMKQRGVSAYHRAILRDTSTVDVQDLH